MREPQKITRQRRGVSLVEVLIVLAILTVGILTIIRLFPGGFLSIRTVQNSTIADRLGEAAIQSLVQNNSALPDAIVSSYYDAPGNSTLDAEIIHGTLKTDSSDPDDPTKLNNARYVSNERITVPSTGVYVVNYGPMDTTATGFFVKGLPWTAESDDSSVGSSFVPSDLSAGQQVFAVDYVNGKIGVPSALYSEPNFELTVNGQTASFTISTTQSGTWLSLSDLGATATLPAAPWTPGQVSLRRIFHSASSFDSDPYEYMLPASGNITGSGNAANVGAIQFNPIAAGQNGGQPLGAQISYTTYDWSILHEDRDVPGSTSSSAPFGLPLRLSLDHLKEIGYLQTDGTNFSGVIPGSNQPVIVVDLGTGLIVQSSNYQINSGSGLVTLASAYNGSHVRIFYAAENDWAVAMQKAPSVYQGSSVTAVPTTAVQAATYLLDTTNKMVYLPRCDAGKTVEIDGIPTTGGGTTSYTASLSLAEAIEPNYVTLDLSKVMTGTAPASGAPFTSVRGLSARAFVAYRERDGNYRMRTVDTVLTRNP